MDPRRSRLVVRKFKVADKEARPYCRAANVLRKISTSRGFLLTALARRTEMSTLLMPGPAARGKLNEVVRYFEFYEPPRFST